MKFAFLGNVIVALCLMLVPVSALAQSKSDLKEQVVQLEADNQKLQEALDVSQSSLLECRNKLEEVRAKYAISSEEKLTMLERQNSLVNQIQRLQSSFDSLLAHQQRNVADIQSTPENYEDSIRETIKNYLRTSTADERIKYVMIDSKTSSRLRSYYSNGATNVEVENDAILILDKLGEYHTVSVRVKGRFGTSILNYFVKKQEGKYVINWEASAGYNDVTLTAYKSGRSSSIEVRVVAKLDDYYNYNYVGKESQYLSVSLRDPISGNVAGYVLRNSTLGKAFASLLSDGREHNIIVKLAADRSQDSSGDINIITGLVSENWLRD